MVIVGLSFSLRQYKLLWNVPAPQWHPDGPNRCRADVYDHAQIEQGLLAGIFPNAEMCCVQQSPYLIQMSAQLHSWVSIEVQARTRELSESLQQQTATSEVQGAIYQPPDRSPIDDSNRWLFRQVDKAAPKNRIGWTTSVSDWSCIECSGNYACGAGL